MKRRVLEVTLRPNYLESALVTMLESVVGPIQRHYGALEGNPRDFYDRDATFTATHTDGTVVVIAMRQSLRGEDDPETYCRFTQAEVRGTSDAAVAALVVKLGAAFDADVNRIELARVAGYAEDRLIEALECVVGYVARTYGELEGNPRELYSRRATFTAHDRNGVFISIVKMDQVLRGPDEPEPHCNFTHVDVRGASEETVRALKERLLPAVAAARYDAPKKRLRLDHVATREAVGEPTFVKALSTVLGRVYLSYSDLSGNPRDFFERDAMCIVKQDDATIITVRLRQVLWGPNDQAPHCTLRDIDVRGPSEQKQRDIAEQLRAVLASIGITTSSPVEEDAPPLPPLPTVTPRPEPTPPPPPTPTPTPPRPITIENYSWAHNVVNGEIVEALVFASTWIERGEMLFAVAPKLRVLHLSELTSTNEHDGPVLLGRLRKSLACPWLKRLTGLATTDIGLVYRETMWDMVEHHSLREPATKILLEADLHHLEVLQIGWRLTDEERETIARKFGCVVTTPEETGAPHWLF